MNVMEHTDLEILLADEVACEITHTETECTRAVVGRLEYTCDEPANACAPAVKWVEDGIASDAWCECGLRCSECWTVRAI